MGSGLNGTLTQDISVLKLITSAKSSTCIVRTLRAETLEDCFPGETLQKGSVPPPLVGHSLTLISDRRALLR